MVSKNKEQAQNDSLEHFNEVVNLTPTRHEGKILSRQRNKFNSLVVISKHGITSRNSSPSCSATCNRVLNNSADIIFGGTRQLANDASNAALGQKLVNYVIEFAPA
jgi:hypothetical protein